MSPPGSLVLQKFHRLDTSLTGLHDQIAALLRGEEYQRCVSNLQGDDLVWLVDYLDKVRRRVVSCYPLLKPA